MIFPQDLYFNFDHRHSHCRYIYTSIFYQRSKEHFLGHSDKDINKRIKTLLPFETDTDFDGGTNLDGCLNDSLFGLDVL